MRGKVKVRISYCRIHRWAREQEVLRIVAMQKRLKKKRDIGDRMLLLKANGIL